MVLMDSGTQTWGKPVRGGCAGWFGGGLRRAQAFDLERIESAVRGVAAELKLC